MHRNRQGHRNSFFGIIPFILLIIGVIIFFRYYLEYVSYLSWTFSPVVIIIVIAAIGGLRSRRRRMRRNSNEESAVRRQSSYRQYQPPVAKTEERDFTSTPKYQYRNHYEQQFCDYCGIKLETEEQSFCVNCGQKIN